MTIGIARLDRVIGLFIEIGHRVEAMEAIVRIAGPGTGPATLWGEGGRWVGAIIKGTPQQGAAVQQESLRIAEAFNQGRILLLNLLPLTLERLQTLLQPHKSLGQQVKGAGEIFRTAADSE